MSFPYNSTVTQTCTSALCPGEQSLLFQGIYKPHTVCVHTLALVLCGKQARPLVNLYLVGQQKVKSSPLVATSQTLTVPSTQHAM
jgi:hypothetical protein